MNKKNLSVEQAFTLAFQNHQKNNLKVAENLYNKILEINPSHPMIIKLATNINKIDHKKISNFFPLKKNIPFIVYNDLLPDCFYNIDKKTIHFVLGDGDNI